MRKKKGNGNRLGSFRSGDRSEYMALYFLSRVAFVSQIPRQEDFGVVDFLCCLGKEQNNLIYAENSFFVQVKANKKKIEFKKSASEWIIDHMDIPLIICVAEKKNNSIDIYSTWRMWWGIINSKDSIQSINLNLDTKQFKSGKTFNEENGKLYIAIGNPILHINYDNIEDNDKQERYYSRLKFWLDIDRANVVGIKEHGVFVNGANSWDINEISEESKLGVYYNFSPTNAGKLEWSATKYLTAFGIYYKKTGQIKNLDIVENTIQLFSEACQEHFQSQILQLEM